MLGDSFGAIERGTAVRALLEFFVRHFDFLYLDARYRITNSKAGGGANAALTVTGPDLTWHISSDRGIFQLSIVPTRYPRDGFGISLIKQYLEGKDDIHYLSAAEEVEWVRVHLERIEQLLSDSSSIESTFHELSTLSRANADKEWPLATK